MAIKERRLNFIQREYCNRESYMIRNKSKGELIGFVEKMRVGSYMHWCFIVSKEMFDFKDADIYQYSPGCQDEIREFCKNPKKYLEKYPNEI